MKADCVIVGGGVIGLSIGYHLVKKGVEVVIVDRKHVGYGSSTRSAAQFRVHFWSDENTLFAIEGRRRLLKAADSLGFNPLVRTNGYLWLFYDDDVMGRYRSRNSRWSELGVEGRMLNPEDVVETYPYINSEGLVGAFHGSQDGSLHHDFLMFGYRDTILKSGGRILEYVDASRIVKEGNGVRGVETSAGLIETSSIVVAGGVWSNEILRSVDVEVPVVPVRREKCVTEPMKPFIKPYVLSTRSEAFHVAQSLRGEVVGGVDHPRVKGSFHMGNTLEHLKVFSRHAVHTIPALRKARVLRVWSGFYEVTPDYSHILGREDDWPKGLFVATGFSGHGLMMAPFAGEVMADLILGNRQHPLMNPYLPNRFREGKLIEERTSSGGKPWNQCLFEEA